MSEGLLNGSDVIIRGVVFLVGTLFIYLLPMIIAATRQHHNGVPIAFLNIFLGWTGIGWVIAFLWAASSPPPANIIIHHDTDVDVENDELEQHRSLTVKRESIILPQANLPDYLFDKKRKR